MEKFSEVVASETVLCAIIVYSRLLLLRIFYLWKCDKHRRQTFEELQFLSVVHRINRTQEVEHFEIVVIEESDLFNLCLKIRALNPRKITLVNFEACSLSSGSILRHSFASSRRTSGKLSNILTEGFFS